MIDAPALTDKIVRKAFKWNIGAEPDADAFRDAVIDVLNAMGVAFTDKTDRSAEEEWAAKCAAIPAVLVDADWIERTRAEAFGKVEAE
jgi:hypothetical protein